MRPEKEKAPAIDRFIGWFSPGAQVKREAARALLAQMGQFSAADVTKLRSDWILPGSIDGQTPDAYELSVLRERSRDAVRNDPIGHGALSTYSENIVGTGLTPQSRMRGAVLGLSDERVSVLQKQAESAWEIFGKMAGSDNRLTMDEIQFLALTKIIEDGETIAIPTWADEPWRPFGRCIELLESERLSNGRNSFDGKIKNGIRFGDRGQPVSYFITKARAKWDANEIAAFDKNGRPKVLHIFPTRRPGQQRGIPVFAPIMTLMRDRAKFMEATLVNARVAACLAVFITSQNPTGLFGTESTDSTGTVAELSPGMVSRLRNGDSINVVNPNQPGDNFSPFIESLHRLTGVALGLPYELLMKDFSKTNYSSARASLLEGRRMFKRWRSWFSQKLCQPIWEMVLEEAYLRGMFDAPDFYKFKHEYCRALWIGGSWGWVDPVKEVEAARKAIDYGLSNLAEECSAQGRDWEENIEQLAREKAHIESKGVKIDKSRPETKGVKEDDATEEK